LREWDYNSLGRPSKRHELVGRVGAYDPRDLDGTTPGRHYTFRVEAYLVLGAVLRETDGQYNGEPHAARIDRPFERHADQLSDLGVVLGTDLFAGEDELSMLGVPIAQLRLSVMQGGRDSLTSRSPLRHGR